MILEDEELDRRVALYKQHGTITAAADACGVARSTFQASLRRAAQRGRFTGSPPVGFEVTQLTERFDADGSLKSRSTVTKPESPEQFEVPEGFLISRRTVYTDADGKVRGAWTRISPEDERAAGYLEACREAFTDLAPVAPIEPPAVCDAEMLNVFPIADAHINQFSAPEVTGEAYNLRIAKEVILGTAQDLLSSTPRAAEAIIPITGDVLHTDDSTNLTPRGKNQLEVDGTFIDGATVTFRLISAIIELALATHERVKVVCLEGNHDLHSYLIIAMGLLGRFENNPRVEILISPSVFYFHAWGSTLLGFTHGHTVDQKEMPLIMAQEVPELWGQAQYKVFYSAHIHHQRAIERGGVMCRSLPAITVRDSHAARSGLTAHRGFIADMFHTTEGPKGRVERLLPPARLFRAAT